MVVVQTFTGGEERQPLQISRSIGVGATAEVMTDSVHGRRTRDVQHGVSACHDGAYERSESNHENRDTDCETEERSIEEPAVPAVGR